MPQVFQYIQDVCFMFRVIRNVLKLCSNIKFAAFKNALFGNNFATVISLIDIPNWNSMFQSYWIDGQ